MDSPTPRWRMQKLRQALLLGALIVGALLLVWRDNWFSAARLRLSDVYFVPQPTTGNIVLVALDDASLNAFGRTPVEWPRSVYVQMIEALIEAQPRVVALDIIFSTEQPDDAALAAALRDLRQNDARTRIVLANAGVERLPLSPPSDTAAVTYQSALPLSPVLAEAADYQGFINAFIDSDGTMRRQASLLRIQQRRELSFSVATTLAYLRVPSSAASKLVTLEDGQLFVTPQHPLPVDAFGLWRQHYYGTPATATRSTYPVIPLLELLSGDYDPALLDDKIVLVGLVNTTSGLDRYPVASGLGNTRMSGVEIQAHAIETILQDAALRSLPDGGYAALIVVLGLAASVLYALPRWYYKIAIAVVLLLLGFTAASLLFSVAQVVISPFDPGLALLLPLVGAIGLDITQETQRRQRTEFLLESLQQVEQQRLQLTQAAAYIVRDLRRLVPGAQATLHLLDAATGELRTYAVDTKNKPNSPTSPALQRALDGAQSGRSIVQEPHLTVIPLRWQRRVLGAMSLRHPRKRRLARAVVQRLDEFAQRLAPSLDNILLHNRVQQQTTLLNAILDGSPAGIVVVDEALRIQNANQSLASWFQMAAAEVEGQRLTDVIAARIPSPPDMSALTEGLPAQQTFAFDLKFGEKALQVLAAPMDDYGLWVLVFTDVTSFVELSELKTRLLRMASHDLKNPLARISGFAELLLMNDDLNDEDKEYLHYIESASEEMKNIIEDLLNLERLRSRGMNVAVVNVSQLVKNVFASQEPDLLRKAQQGALHLPDEDCYIQGDPAHISQMVSNLLSNAIKYTPDSGSVTVRLQARGTVCLLEVSDTGYGIPEDAHDRLFNEFFRVRTAQTREIPGTGLGLSLVKAVIEAHRGQVWFTSKVGQGSTFTVRLPITTPPAS